MTQQLPHVRNLDIKNDGIEQEVVVMKEDPYNGDLYIIPTVDMDKVDRERIIKILSHRDATRLPLYEVMALEYLGNGMNALEFFHQLVKIRTVDGNVFPVSSGKRGAPRAVQGEERTEKRAGPGRQRKE